MQTAVFTENAEEPGLKYQKQVDRPAAADPAWLAAVEAAYGPVQLVPMTRTGERGLLCTMHILPESRPLLQRFPSPFSTQLAASLQPLRDAAETLPQLWLRWDRQARLWRSALTDPTALPPEIRAVFARSGPGCLAAETDAGVVHLCHAPDADIQSFRHKPAGYRWQLLRMPTAPLIRLLVHIHDRPADPYRFESFLHVGDDTQLDLLAQLAGQAQLHLAFYGDDLTYRYTKVLPHDAQQWQQLDELTARALAYWHALPPATRDFDRAKAAFLRRPF